MIRKCPSESFKDHFYDSSHQGYFLSLNLRLFSFLDSKIYIIFYNKNFEEMIHLFLNYIDHIFKANTVILPKLIEQNESAFPNVGTETFKVKPKKYCISHHPPFTHIFFNPHCFYLLVPTRIAKWSLKLALTWIGEACMLVFIVGLNCRQAVLVLHYIRNRHRNWIIYRLALFLAHWIPKQGNKTIQLLLTRPLSEAVLPFNLVFYLNDLLMCLFKFPT
jgi:hypothetical protein